MFGHPWRIPCSVDFLFLYRLPFSCKHCTSTQTCRWQFQWSRLLPLDIGRCWTPCLRNCRGCSPTSSLLCFLPRRYCNRSWSGVLLSLLKQAAALRSTRSWSQGKSSWLQISCRLWRSRKESSLGLGRLRLFRWLDLKVRWLVLGLEWLHCLEFEVQPENDPIFCLNKWIFTLVEQFWFNRLRACLLVFGIGLGIQEDLIVLFVDFVLFAISGVFVRIELRLRCRHH